MYLHRVHYETYPSVTATVPLLNASPTPVRAMDLFSSNTFSCYSNSLQLRYFSVSLEFQPAETGQSS